MKKILSIVISAVLLVLTLTATVSVETSAVNTSQTYKVYNATTGSYIKSYTLAPNAVEDKSRTIIGTDDRVVDFTKSGVVKIIANGGFGTGFVVDAHTIATAAHCVCSGIGNNATSMKINKILVFNSVGDIDINITNAKQIHIPINFMSSNDINYDYALITVEQDLSAYANFNLGVTLDSFQNSGKPISCTGFPGEISSSSEPVNDSNNKHIAYTGNGVIMPNGSDYKIYYNCDTSGGNSGGPVYTTSILDGKYYYTVIGIHTNGFSQLSNEKVNKATRITTNLLHFYKNNSNITY